MRTALDNVQNLAEYYRRRAYHYIPDMPRTSTNDIAIADNLDTVLAEYRRMERIVKLVEEIVDAWDAPKGSKRET